MHRAVGSGAAGAAQAAPLLKAREAWLMIIHVHADVHGPKIYIGPKFFALRAETLSIVARPLFRTAATSMVGPFSSRQLLPSPWHERLRISSARSHHFYSYSQL